MSVLILPADAAHEDSPEQCEPDEEDQKNATAIETLVIGRDDLQSEASPSGNDELTEDVALRTEEEEEEELVLPGFPKETCERSGRGYRPKAKICRGVGCEEGCAREVQEDH